MKKFFLLLLLYTPITYVIAGELVYQPQNSSFGGSAATTQILMSKASAQNTLKDPEVEDQTELDKFKDQLERRILSLLARAVVDGLYDIDEEGFGDGGTFSTDDFSVSVLTDNPDVLVVEINEVSTGDVTSIEIPQF